MFLGIDMFLALLRAHFNPRYARAKMILSRAKNIFMPANVNSIVIFLTIRSSRNAKNRQTNLHIDFNDFIFACSCWWFRDVQRILHDFDVVWQDAEWV